jgi:hypothetical protein
MGAWKLVVYPFGLAIIGMMLVDLVGIALFGPNGREWLDWQNQVVSTCGMAAGLAGAVAGLYAAIRAHARLTR